MSHPHLGADSPFTIKTHDAIRRLLEEHKRETEMLSVDNDRLKQELRRVGEMMRDFMVREKHLTDMIEDLIAQAGRGSSSTPPKVLYSVTSPNTLTSAMPVIPPSTFSPRVYTR